MKKILCYGDSNTFGFNPENFGRYNKNERWSGILSELLPDFEIIEEGMNNRLGFFDSPEGLKHSGGKYLSLLMKDYKDIDIFILALGTNDAQFFFNLDENIAKNGLENLVRTIYQINKNTKIILIPPVKIEENIIDGMFQTQFDLESVEKIKRVFPLYQQIAKEYDCLYFDFNQFTTPSETDGLHYTKESHKIIAQNLAKFIEKYYV